MIIENEPLLASYRKPGKCSWCGKTVRMLCAAHIFGKGAGRIDAAFNLVALGMDAVVDCTCHHDSHLNGIPGWFDLLTIAAVQNRCGQDDIVQLVYLIRRLDRDTTREQMFAAIKRECRPSARALARRTL